MDWNGNLRSPFVPRPENSLNFLFNYNYDHLYPGLEMKYHYPVVAQATQAGVVGGGMEKKNNTSYGGGNIHHHHHHQEEDQKIKKRLTSEQLESLESSFQEEVKLDPDRKMKLARDLGLQPRQIAVWFQNRRARWKAKQLERLYDALKLEYSEVSREKLKLQEEVLALKAKLKEQTTKNQVSTGHTEISVTEETVESTSVGDRSSGKPEGGKSQQLAEGSYVFNVDDYNPAIPMPCYWGSNLPCYP